MLKTQKASFLIMVILVQPKINLQTIFLDSKKSVLNHIKGNPVKI